MQCHLVPMIVHGTALEEGDDLVSVVRFRGKSLN